jgi:pimeloyl-ACP methyl ester carboxylesterase
MMKPGPEKLHPPRKRRTLAKICLALSLLALFGCGFGTRFIFSSTTDVRSTPAKDGLAFRDVWFSSADGVRLHGWYVPGEKGRPLVVFFHGDAANISYRVGNLLFLHRLGLPVFIFDYRGFGSSQGEALHENDLYQDARGALAWLKSIGWSPSRMVFYGRSLGSAVALQMAIESPPKGLILECPFTSLPAIAREMTPVTYGLFGWWSIDARFDNLAKIPHLRCPVLIIHGDRDRIIPWSMGKALFDKAPSPKTFLTVHGAGHSNAFKVGGEIYKGAWKRFLREINSL